MTEPETWLEGPPTEPGLYWFQLQHSAVVRHCEVVQFRGKLVVAGADGTVPVRQPYRRWMSARYARPTPDPEWLDPRFIAERKQRS